MKDTTPNFKTVLKSMGYKATPGRMRLLEVLWDEEKPVAVASLEKKLKGALDTVTLYRNLESLVAARMVREVDFRHGHAHYELDRLRDHHHHIVCTSCGAVEDTSCDMTPVLKKVAGASKHFSTVTDHSTEFFGLCKKCAR